MIFVCLLVGLHVFISQLHKLFFPFLNHFFQGAPTERVISEERKKAQSAVDANLVKFFEKPENALLKQYMKTRFTLRNRMYWHAMKF